MGHDLHPDSELGQARRLRGSGAWSDVLEEMAPAWVEQPTMSHIEIGSSVRVQASAPRALRRRDPGARLAL
jgi:hypothetical protein